MSARARVRWATETAANALVLPWTSTYGPRAMAFGAERAHQDLAEHGARWSGRTGEARRLALYRRLGVEIGDHAVLRWGSLLLRPPVSIGSMTVIGHHSVVQHAVVGDDCLIGTGVQILDGKRQHGWDRTDMLIREQPERSVRTTVGNDTFIGGGATILSDVGNHCVVGAGSVVTKPVPDWAIVAGAPARVVGDRRDRAGAAVR